MACVDTPPPPYPVMTAPQLRLLQVENLEFYIFSPPPPSSSSPFQVLTLTHLTQLIIFNSLVVVASYTSVADIYGAFCIGSSPIDLPTFL